MVVCVEMHKRVVTRCLNVANGQLIVDDTVEQLLVCLKCWENLRLIICALFGPVELSLTFELQKRFNTSTTTRTYVFAPLRSVSLLLDRSCASREYL